VDYLNAVESFLLRSSGGIMLQGGDEDLLGLYLLNNRTFPKADVLLVGDDIWRGFEERDEVKKRREAEKVSHLWDGLIETLAQHEKEGTWEYSLNGKEAEPALRTMARENRYNRRILSQNLDDVLRTTPNGATRGRLVESPSGVAYVILATRKGRDRDERRAELYWRCFVARDVVPGVTTVVGIATETYNPKDPGFSFDVCQLEFQDWTLEQRKQAQELREKNGWFPQDKQERLQVDEYPQ
jgi:hypothetical protein